MAHKKPLALYESEAKWAGECLVHPSCGAARKCYERRHGDLPSTIAVCHTCDNTKCILDAHHFPGTWGDNVRDAVAKKRHSCCRRGSEANRHILSEAQVISIRKSSLSCAELGSIYGVHLSTISKIRTGKNWGWL